MKEYKVLRLTDSPEGISKKVNVYANDGWRVVNCQESRGDYLILIERDVHET